MTPAISSYGHRVRPIGSYLPDLTELFSNIIGSRGKAQDD